MKQKLIGLSQRYVTTLRRHLKEGARAKLEPALRLGRQAVVLGLETLELARIHEGALVTLGLPTGSKGEIQRTKNFFTAANTPIEKTHRAARQNKFHLSRLKKTLRRRTNELAVSQRQWQRGVVRHKVREDAFEKGGKAHNKCLEESLQLQNRLRQLTHRALEAQENERYQISHELQDEIAQTLLGINVRLLSLKQAARSDSKGLKNAIASAQRLVVRSVKSVRRFARKLETPHPMRGARSMKTL